MSGWIVDKSASPKRVLVLFWFWSVTGVCSPYRRCEYPLMLIRIQISALFWDYKTHIFKFLFQNDCLGLDSVGKGPVIARETRREIILLMKQQFVVTHTIRQTDIPALLASWVTNTTLSKCCLQKKNCFLLHCRKKITCLSVGPLMIGQVYFRILYCVGGLRQIDVSCAIQSLPKSYFSITLRWSPNF